LKEEGQLFDSILIKLNEYRQGIVENLILGKEVRIESRPKSIKTQEEPSNENALLRFVEAVPKFVGIDLKQYGPFQIEDVANLPKEVAKVLTHNKRAEEM